MWLKDLLPDDLPQARILSYGYDADTHSFAHTSSLNIFQHAEAFVEELSRQRRANPERPVIFLAHSLGGIILKRALALCHNDSFKSNHGFRDILTSTAAILFFGTPHSGTNGIQLAEWMCRAVSIFMSTNKGILSDLGRDSPALEDIQAQYNPASEGIDTISFYEEYPTPTIGGLPRKIVPRQSAIIAGDARARVAVLHANHCQMIKFSDKDDGDYLKVVNYLHELMEKGPQKVRNNWLKEASYRRIAKGELSPIQQAVFPKPLLPVSRNYVQRPHIDNFITEKLLPQKPVTCQPWCVLHGLGGGGKTQVASSWIETHKQRFTRVIVVDASSRGQIKADLTTAIRSIGPEYSKSTWRDTVAYLSGQKGWLLYFDNADSPDLRLNDYLPNSIHGAILVTTRNRELISYAPDSHISVGMLTEDEAIDLLHKVSDLTPPSNESSLAIVKELGMWALAITQAGAYIFKTCRLDSYLATFRQHREKLMREASLR
ncbi:hypothetical protein FRC17_006277, partial [Serendipita sp. 399]